MEISVCAAFSASRNRASWKTNVGNCGGQILVAALGGPTGTGGGGILVPAFILIGVEHIPLPIQTTAEFHSRLGCDFLWDDMTWVCE